MNGMRMVLGGVRPGMARHLGPPPFYIFIYVLEKMDCFYKKIKNNKGIKSIY